MTSLIHWTPELSVGIEVIDVQHRRIVDYINQLHELRQRGDRDTTAAILENLLDYTLTHFSFEEVVMEEAGYRWLVPHRKVHGLFVRRVSEYQQRFALGEDVSGELQETLTKWLINHIKREDRDYASVVRTRLSAERLREIQKSDAARRGKDLNRFIGRR